ncbi:MAG: DEAD/DEAH box helicase family protein [Verrucomicrobia bacterium]|nr:DEAD/DEAH box helicase family protein [Verrucomicrobiota bacterium]
MIRRFSSRQGEPYQEYLNEQLAGARNYWRIAGYFTVSVLEVAGDAIEKLQGKAQIICNSQLSAKEFQATGGRAMNREWGAYWDEIEHADCERLKQLLRLIRSGKLEIRVAPDDRFGLVHGKAGIIEKADGSKLAFLGSNNETRAAWKDNYELMWEDDSAEAVAWVRGEFDHLWDAATPLSEFVIKDIERLANGTAVAVEDWRAEPDADAVVTTNDLYRKAQGLWDYQQQFVDTAFRHHVEGEGARFLLADQVGLGKTPQMALAAALMGLYSGLPVLIIVPKTLVEQWQAELMDLLGLPSARWESARKQWVTNTNEIVPAPLENCPRRIGILSQGLVVHSQAVRDTLTGLRGGYACVVIDEAHRARVQRTGQRTRPNNLMRFAREISPRTRSFILGTATPVQLAAIEAFDLLEALDGGTNWILGTASSNWRQLPEEGIDIACDRNRPANERDAMVWLGNPFPHALENGVIAGVRQFRQINGLLVDPAMEPRLLQDLRIQAELRQLPDHTPYVRRIVQRTRADLELAGLLPKIHVDPTDEIIPMPAPLAAAYALAGEYCDLLRRRKAGTGFLETLLLRRMGSSFFAGLKTSERLLRKEFERDEAEEEESDDEEESESELQQLLERAGNEETQKLAEIIEQLQGNFHLDAKFVRLKEFLFDRAWAKRGCIVFSQYYETTSHFAELLSKEANMADKEVPVYAGEAKAGIWLNGQWAKAPRQRLKERAMSGDFEIFFGTDAASEGLNLQYHLSTLINLDAPWSPTRLDQRTGRVRRIGQPKGNVLIASFRYEGSVEDTVWQRLSSRYGQIYELMGTLPDVLRDAWVHQALDNQAESQRVIDGVPNAPPLRLNNQLTQPAEEWGFSQRYLKKEQAYIELSKAWGVK